ncbi:unnamed protein product [Callosobruchus maculatus]|uniref:Uncharacterized protein n=1 Tax=Callosobruchus maculatus TaxID=64391 RepID=A0A653BZJ2_CALMS|nr:unnamed protein product [Callosobruchus maculatus]VEN60194.1 unnamed protein product [Callosobruchus maculatus]
MTIKYLTSVLWRLKWPYASNIEGGPMDHLEYSETISYAYIIAITKMSINSGLIFKKDIITSYGH